MRCPGTECPKRNKKKSVEKKQAIKFKCKTSDSGFQRLKVTERLKKALKNFQSECVDV